MGLFAFLTGKKDEIVQPAGAERSRAADHDRPADHDPVRRADDPPTDTPPNAAGRSSADGPQETPSSATGSATPFTPPEAWNTDALTAPPPADLARETPQIGEPDADQTAALQAKIIEVIKTVYDPEIPVDIYELGLIYEIVVDAERRVLIRMTLTSPACPSAQQIPSEVRYKVKALPEVTDAWVEIVWEPPWDKDRMSEAAKLSLGFF